MESHCPVCLRIYIEPVTLPCDHSICKPCFDEIIKQSNLECPMCRRRIGSWARLQTRKGNLINQEMWNSLKKEYAKDIEARLLGTSTPIKTKSEPIVRELAESGEIRKEYEKELYKVQQERAEQELASEKLIKEMLAQDEKELAAFRVANKENKPAASQGLRLPLPKRSSSLDSITGEYSRYFKPIARYPRTPPRPTEKEKGYPETIKVTPCPQTVKRLDFSCSSPPDSKTSSGEASSSKCVDKLSSGAAAPSAHNAGKNASNPFLLPLQTIADDRSNDGSSIISASTDTSTFNTGLRINTTSPIVPIYSRSRDGTERSGATSDTLSYHSDLPSPELKRRKRGPRQKMVKKNGFINNKSTKSYMNANGERRTRSCATSSIPPTTSQSRNGTRSCSDSRSYSGSRTCSEKDLRNDRDSCPDSRSKHSLRSQGRSRSSNSSGNCLPSHTQATNGTTFSNGHTEPAFVDSDEQLAKKLQEVYNMEKKYNLSSLRCAGSGNEYNTRKRSKTQSSN